MPRIERGHQPAQPDDELARGEPAGQRQQDLAHGRDLRLGEPAEMVGETRTLDRSTSPARNAAYTWGRSCTSCSARSHSRSAARRDQARAARTSSAAWGTGQSRRSTAPSSKVGVARPISAITPSSRAASWAAWRDWAASSDNSSLLGTRVGSIRVRAAASCGPGGISARAATSPITTACRTYIRAPTTSGRSRRPA
jgi:hypothetical protein